MDQIGETETGGQCVNVKLIASYYTFRQLS